MYVCCPGRPLLLQHTLAFVRKTCRGDARRTLTGHRHNHDSPRRLYTRSSFQGQGSVPCRAVMRSSNKTRPQHRSAHRLSRSWEMLTGYRAAVRVISRAQQNGIGSHWRLGAGQVPPRRTGVQRCILHVSKQPALALLSKVRMAAAAHDAVPVTMRSRMPRPARVQLGNAFTTHVT